MANTQKENGAKATGMREREFSRESNNVERRRSLRREVERQLEEEEEDHDHHHDVASSPEARSHHQHQHHYRGPYMRPAPELLSFRHPTRNTSYFHSHHGRHGSHRQVFRKERYVQANFKLLVSDDEFVKMCGVDPDYEIPWDNVEEVFTFSAEPLQCPLCLFPPQASRCAKCGHVFCLTCFLRYFCHGMDPAEQELLFSQPQSEACRKKYKYKHKRCPLCFEPVRLEELKPVTCEVRKGVQDGSIGDFVLIKRDEDGNIVPLASDTDQMENNRDTSNVMWDRVYRIDSSSALVTIERDYSDLKEVESGASGFDDELLPYIQIARDMLDVRKQKWNKDNDDDNVEFGNESENGNEKGKDTKEGKEETRPHPQGQSQSFNEEDVNNGRAKGHNPMKSYYFYQSRDGSPVYLLPLCSRVLLEDHSSFTAPSMPKTLSAPIVEIEQFTMSHELRKRIRHLSHLPLGSEFALAEMDMRKITTPKARNTLASELRQRTKQRQARKRIDMQNQRKAEAAESASEPSAEMFRIPLSPPVSPSPHFNIDGEGEAEGEGGVYGGEGEGEYGEQHGLSFVDALRTPLKVKGIDSDVGMDVGIDGVPGGFASSSATATVPWGPSGLLSNNSTNAQDTSHPNTPNAWMRRSESVPSVPELYGVGDGGGVGGASDGRNKDKNQSRSGGKKGKGKKGRKGKPLFTVGLQRQNF